MTAPHVLFVPGLPDKTPAPLLAHRFGHALAAGGWGEPVVLEREQYSAVAWGTAVRDDAVAPGGIRRHATAEELQYYGDLRANIEEEGPQALKAPADPVLLDPLLFDAADPPLDALRCFFAPLWDYTVDREFRYSVQRKVLAALEKLEGRPVVLVAHGVGCVAAMDVLYKMADKAPHLQFVTLGSPLGLERVKRRLKVGAREDGMHPVPEGVMHWVNVASPLDPVCGDAALAKEYRWNADPERRVEDRGATLHGGWPLHAWTEYLQSAEVREVLAGALSRASEDFHLPTQMFRVPGR
jgi:predicted alpha/beta hydrolase family esterase